MKYTVDVIKRINGNVKDDQIIANIFCIDTYGAAQNRAKIISDICELIVILDAKALSQATDALAGIRHIVAVVEDVAEFHIRGNLGETFGSQFKKLVLIRENAEREYRWLCSLFPSNTSV